MRDDTAVYVGSARLHDMRGTGTLHIHETENGQWYSVRRDGRDPNPQVDHWIGNIVLGLVLVAGLALVMLAIGHALMPAIHS